MTTKCTRCNGKGSIMLRRAFDGKPTTFQCPRCKGSGIRKKSNPLKISKKAMRWAKEDRIKRDKAKMDVLRSLESDFSVKL